MVLVVCLIRQCTIQRKRAEQNDSISLIESIENWDLRGYGNGSESDKINLVGSEV